MGDWLASLRGIAGAAPTALISVLATEGAAPCDAGCHMLVTAGRIIGTIGGGLLETRAVEQARALVAQPAGNWRIQDIALESALGQCCAGRVRLMIEHLDPARLGWLDEAAEGRVLVSTLAAGHVERHVESESAPTRLSVRGDRPRAGTRIAEIIGQRRRPLYLFGAGHVGQAIARHAQSLPFRLAWFDTRPLFESIEGVAVVPDAAMEICIAEAPADAALVILTHDHGLDYRLARAALCRPVPVAFVGLIGSATLRARFLARLAREGVAADARARLTCPIGMDGVDGKAPDVIAIGTLAQLLQLRPAGDDGGWAGGMRYAIS